MTDVIMTRIETGDQGTFGRLVAGSLTLYSGELPWLDNQPNISCVPDGVYQCVWTFSEHFRRFMYLLLGTSPRAGIREHSANLMGNESKGFKKQLNGCIAYGERLGWIGGQKALILSAPAVRRFEDHMQRKPFTLGIKWNS